MMKTFKLFAAVLAVAMVATVSYAAGAKKAATIWTAAEEKWEPLAPNVPLQIVKLWGDQNKGGSSGILLKLPAGSDSGVHAHTNPYHGVLIQGTWIHTEEGSSEPAKELGPGSYVMQPGMTMHRDVCKAGTDCIVVVTKDKKFDFIPSKDAKAGGDAKASGDAKAGEKDMKK